MRVPPTHIAIRVIQDEHDQLAAVIKGMQHFLRAIDKGENAPEPKVFRAMLLYIIEYPEKVHHPKEDQTLFARLRQRTDQVNQELDALEAEHAQGESQVKALEQALIRYESEGDAAFREFFELVEAYAAFYFNHMRIEESVILPAACQYLAADDWAMIDAQFAANQELQAGANAKEHFDKLFSLIANITPAPVGLGPAIQN
jgi:hemerythrin-like domain-containing protein